MEHLVAKQTVKLDLWTITNAGTEVFSRNGNNALFNVLATITKNEGSRYERKYFITETVLHIGHVSQ
jgi:hypothetical protein